MLASALLISALPATALAAPLSPKPVISPAPVISPSPVIAPQTGMSRGMVVQRLWEMSGKPVVNYAMQFDDVPTNSDMTEAIRWASAEGIASGYGNEKFGPNDQVTREQLSTIIYHYISKFDMGFKGNWMFYLPWNDISEIHSWAVKPMYWMAVNRLLDGNAEEGLPLNEVTVAEADAIFDALLILAQEKQVDFHEYQK